MEAKIISGMNFKWHKFFENQFVVLYDNGEWEALFEYEDYDSERISIRWAGIYNKTRAEAIEKLKQMRDDGIIVGKISTEKES